MSVFDKLFIMTIYSVSQINQVIKGILEPQFRQIKVKGEVTNLRYQSSGHVYFSLKDHQSQISAVMFRLNASKLKNPIKSGDHVVIAGELSIYSPRGSYQIIVRSLVQEGIGNLLLELHKRKEQMKNLGWFDADKKKALPSFPKIIGVITSPTGSVIQDILHVLTRRFYGFHLILLPVKVQGEGAAKDIAEAIKSMNKYQLTDVLIVGRGGGSLEDLWAFNETIVVEAAYKSQIPIISAIGHETDYTLTDLVADVRAPTPSAAAEIVIKEQASLLANLQTAQNQLDHHLKLQIKHAKDKLQHLSRQPALCDASYLLKKQTQQLDEFSSEINWLMKERLSSSKLRLDSFNSQVVALNPINRILEKAKRLKQIQKTLDVYALDILKRQKDHLQRLFGHLTSLNPKKILQKGYCIPFREKTTSVIMSVKQAKACEKLQLLFHDGKVVVTTIEKEPL